MQPYPPMGQMPGMMPGQPGSPYAYQPPPPSAPRTLGTLSIVFGAIVAAMSLFGLVSSSTGMMAAIMDKMPSSSGGGAALTDYMHAVRVPSMIQGSVMIAMAVWLLVLGVGQRGYRAWAARQSVAWGLIALVVTIGMAVIAFGVTLPAGQRMLDEIQRSVGHSNPFGGMGGMMVVGTLFGVAVYLPYPIIMLVTFRRPQVVAAMTA